ncbi:MAG: AhpC/TSA family protein, partial [Sediminibacterium sp.]|nr:AhpC/TSA family protein [Sediminibacterium sp.]
MKKTLVVFALLFALSAMAQNEKFNLKGTYTNISMPVQKVYIYYRVDDKNLSDSMVPKDGSYSFSGKIPGPLLATLRMKYEPGADGKPVKAVSNRDYAAVFLEPGELKVASVDSFSNVTVKGSKAHDEYGILTAMLKPVTDKMNVASAAYSKAAAAKDEPARKAAEDQIDQLDKDSKVIYGEYARTHLQSPIAFYAVSQFAGWDINVDAVEPLFLQLPASQRETTAAKTLAAQIEIAKKTSIGKTALDFVQNDTLGVPVKLSSFRGKYLLVDFWASWCGPCRRENPNVVRAFNEFKDKGFHIL